MMCVLFYILVIFNPTLPRTNKGQGVNWRVWILYLLKKGSKFGLSDSIQEDPVKKKIRRH